MRTTTICVLFILAGFTLKAQDEAGNPFRPSKNNFSVEVNFKPFSSDAPISIDGFRGRLFLSNKLAIRVGCNFAMEKIYSETPVENNNTTYFNSDDERYTVLGVHTGVEYHFLNSKRFSPYVGIVVGYENETSKAVYEDLSMDGTSYPYTYRMVKTEVKNSWYYSSGSSGTYHERGYSMFSCNAVLGADFYLMKHLYMGIELGIGYNAMFYKEIEVTVDGVLDSKIPKAKETNSGIGVNNSIRLGFWF
jgi:hypothetical protein